MLCVSQQWTVQIRRVGSEADVRKRDKLRENELAIDKINNQEKIAYQDN